MRGPKCKRRQGFKQLSGTCWFNAPLNGFLLGDLSSRLLARMIHTAPDRDALIAFDYRDVCPSRLASRAAQRAAILSHAARHLVGIRTLTGDSYNVGLQLARAGGFPNPDGGGEVLDAMLRLLQVLFEPGEAREFFVRGSDVIVPEDAHDAKLMFACRTLRNQSLPLGIRWPRRVENMVLDHAVIVYTGYPYPHAVVGFMCGGQPYVYDSNAAEAVRADWPRGDLSAYFDTQPAGYQYSVSYVSHVVYVNPARTLLPARRFDHPVNRPTAGDKGAALAHMRAMVGRPLAEALAAVPDSRRRAYVADMYKVLQHVRRRRATK